jgi:hypothetical protein
VEKKRSRALVTMLSIVVLVAGLTYLTACGSAATSTTAEASTSTVFGGSTAESLTFPVDDYTVQTKTMAASSGTVQITYHLYQNLAYVADPVDADYQSLDVAVPVKIDGRAVDATNAPILFDINVGGYMSSANGRSAGTSAGEGGMSSNADLALAAGYVVVSPGCRGRDNVSVDGTYYGKAPAAVVDLKCAVKYIRYNDDLMPGNADWIISTGGSAGGALSALLGASGDSDLYQSYFDELGAADASDAIYASACYCPITDLDHADSAYEWEFGTTALSAGGTVDQTLSAQLAAQFGTYLASLGLLGKSGFGNLTADNYGDYLVQTYLVPSATEYLSSLPESERQAYLAAHTWITWSGSAASFTWNDYVAHVGRMKSLPAFDAFDLSTAECSLFGDATTGARHFTAFSLQQTGDDDSAVARDLQTIVSLMNPMYFIGEKNSGCAGYWWIRHGTKDNDTSLPVIIDLAASLDNLGKDVNTALYWDAGHGANADATDFMAWIEAITGYSM